MSQIIKIANKARVAVFFSTYVQVCFMWKCIAATLGGKWKSALRYDVGRSRFCMMLKRKTVTSFCDNYYATTRSCRVIS